METIIDLKYKLEGLIQRIDENLKIMNGINHIIDDVFN